MFVFIPKKQSLSFHETFVLPHSLIETQQHHCNIKIFTKNTENIIYSEKADVTPRRNFEDRY